MTMGGEGDAVLEGAPVVLRARDFAVRRGSTTLLAPSSFDVYEGERVLVLGASGSGKSLFTDVLLGFVGEDVQVSGTLALDGEDLLHLDPGAHDGKVGAVFQLHALGLFDDLTVDQNLAFGSTDAARQTTVAEEMRLADRGRPVTTCSGGERVRVALARTVLRGARVLVYDEPTTGLDAAAAEQVVRSIRESHERLTLVVTHDFAAFEREAGAVLFIDPATRAIVRRPLTPQTLPDVRRALEAPPVALTTSDATPTWVDALGARIDAFAQGLGGFVYDMGALVLLPWCWLRVLHPLDGPRLRGALRRNLAPGVFAFAIVSAMLVSMTGTYFLFERLPKSEYTAPLVQEDLIAGLGLVFTRAGIPLLVSVLLAAKLGASAAAHLGHMALTRQVDALRLLDISPRRHLLLPTATGQLFSAWGCTLACAGAAWFAALVVFLMRHPGWSSTYFRRAWSRELAFGDVGWIVAKVAVSALGVAVIAFRAGTRPKRQPGDVVDGIHATLLRGLLFVILVHALFAFAEF